MTKPFSSQTWFIIVNPNAGGGKALKLWPKLRQALCGMDISFEFSFTDKKEHAIAIAQQASCAGHRHFVAIGGDGTVNEVLQGLAASEAELSEHFLTVIPWGTGNDWAAMHGIPTTIKAQCAMLKQPRFVQHDIGVAYFGEDFSQQRYFLNFIGTGFDSFLLQKMGGAAGKRWKYYQSLLTCLFSYSSPAFMINDTHHSRSLMLMCCIGEMGGAGMKFAPDAAYDDGLFDIINIHDMPLVQRILSLPSLMNGKIKQHKKVISSLSDTLNIACEQPFQFQCDGELVGQLPVRIAIEAKAINVISMR